MATAQYVVKLNDLHAKQIQLSAEIEAAEAKLNELKTETLAIMDKNKIDKFETSHGSLKRVAGFDTVIDTLKFKALVTSEQFDQCVKVQVTKAQDYVSKVMLDTVSTKKAKAVYVKFTEKTKKA